MKRARSRGAGPRRSAPRKARGDGDSGTGGSGGSAGADSAAAGGGGGGGGGDGGTGGEDLDAPLIAALLFESGMLGIAYYDTASASLHVSSTRCEAGEVAWLVGAFKQQLVEREPTLCVTTAATPAAAVQALGQRGGATAGEGAALEGVVPVKVLPRSEFRADLARMLLASVVVPDWQQQRPATASAPASASASASAAAAAAGPAALPASFDLAFARLSSIVNTDDAALVRAAGGLLHFLRQGGRLIEAELDDGALGGLAEAPDMMAAAGDEYGGGGGTPAAALRPITLRGGLHVFSLGAHMQVDAVTYSALNILPPLGASAGAAGGLSLQALLDRTRSAPGRRLLRTWLQQPSLDLDALRHRHDAVELLVAAAAQAPDLIAALRTHLRGAKDIARMLLSIKKVAASPADWLGVLRSVQAALAIKSVVAQLLRAVRLRKGGAAAAAAAAAEPAAAGAAASAPDSAQSPLLLKQLVAEVSDEQLAYVQSALDMIIDWAASQEARRLRVRSGVDATLDEHRRVYEQLPDFLSGVAVQQLQNFPQLRSLAIKYLPQIGCVFCIDKADHELLEGGGDEAAGAPAAAAAAAGTTQFARVAGSARTRALVPADFVLQFETAEALHYKTPYTAELDRDIGDVAAVAADIEAAICRQLEDRLLEQELLLLTVGARLAEVDVLAAFAEVAAERRYCRPQLVDDAVVFARQARHPLQELTVETFVPNDIALAPAGRHAGIAAVAVVTGPNFSGKSVYLKTVGLLAFMAQVGSFVPAQEARVGLVDRLFSRIHSLETLSLGLSSSFAIDLNQVGLMMKHATPRSLLLVDEFGKGTSAVDGVCLLAAAIRHLLRAATVPRTVITTHFREVFDHGLLDVHGGGGGGSSGGSSELDVAYFQMQVILSRGGGATSTAPASLSSSAADAATDYEDDVTPLFRLAPGRAGSSHGLACALRAGMPRRITDRAAAVSSMLKRGAVVTPLPGYLDDASRRAHERMQMRLLQALLAPPAWEPPADGGAAAGADDLAAVLGLLDAMCHG